MHQSPERALRVSVAGEGSAPVEGMPPFPAFWIGNSSATPWVLAGPCDDTLGVNPHMRGTHWLSEQALVLSIFVIWGLTLWEVCFVQREGWWEPSLGHQSSPHPPLSAYVAKYRFLNGRKTAMP